MCLRTDFEKIYNNLPFINTMFIFVSSVVFWYDQRHVIKSNHVLTGHRYLFFYYFMMVCCFIKYFWFMKVIGNFSYW